MGLTPVKEVELPPIMADADAQTVMAALGAGPERDAPAACFVGGCVRNSLLGLAPGDIDIATQHMPEQVMQRLHNAGIRVIETGVEHGTVTAIGPATGRPFEITTLRRDVATDGRHAEVAFSTDWVEDARRRDFTMNTLLCDLQGRIYDPLGEGVADLEARQVRFVGDPAQRIAEDYLRILRFLRFHAEYGRGSPDAQGLTACRVAADHVYTLARERIAQEFFKIVAVNNPVDTLKIMFDNNILGRLFHSGYRSETLRALCDFQEQAGHKRIAPRLLMLSGLDESHYTGLDRILTLPNPYKRAGLRILNALSHLNELSGYYYRILIYFYGHEIASDAFLIQAARSRSHVLPPYGRGEDSRGGIKFDSGTLDYGPGPSDVIRIVKDHADWKAPKLPVNGDDMQALGIKRGPELGEILKQVEAWWLEQDFAPDRQACMDYARSLITDD